MDQKNKKQNPKRICELSEPPILIKQQNICEGKTKGGGGGFLIGCILNKWRNSSNEYVYINNKETLLQICTVVI